MSLVRKVALNNSIILFERLSASLLGFLVTIWLIRYLGTENFGVYSLVFAWFTFLNVFTPPMIELVVAREAVLFPALTRKYLGAGLAIKIGLALLGWVSGITAAVLLGYPPRTVFFLSIVLLGLLGNASFILQVPHQIELRLLRPSVADGLSAILYQSGRAIAILIRLGLFPFFWIYLGYRLVQLLFFSLLSLEKKEYRPDFNFSVHEVRGIFRASWILLLNNVFIMVISRIDQLIIYQFLGARQVGLYGSCANLTDYLVLIPVSWYLTVFPLLVKYLGESGRSFEKANHYSYKYNTIIVVIAWIIFGGFSRQILSLLFGPDFMEADTALFWLSTAVVFIFLYYGLFNAALSRGKEKAWLWVNGAGAAVNVALNLILIPIYGIAGAGFATFAAFITQVLLAGALPAFRPDFLLMLKASAWPVVLAAALVAVSRTLELKLLIFGPVMLAAYLVLLLLTRTINQGDLKLFYQAVGLKTK